MDNIDDRVDALLRRISKGAEQRDQIIETVSRTVADVESISACVNELRAVSQRMLPSFVDNGANIARTISVSASLAEKSFFRVKRLDMLLHRVREAKVVADSLQDIRRTVSLVNDAIEKGDLERTIEFIRSYEEAKVRLGARAHFLLFSVDDRYDKDVAKKSDGCNFNKNHLTIGNGVAVNNSEVIQNKDFFLENKSAIGAPFLSVAGLKASSINKEDPISVPGGPFSCSEVENVIADARKTVRERLVLKFQAASRENDKTTLMHTTRLITRLGFSDDGCGLYCTWMCEHTINALKSMVECELRKMDDPNEAAMSHLALVSTALDIVVAVFEDDEEFMRDTFGSAGVLMLLAELHNRSTTQCVPVLRNFLDRRQEVLPQITLAFGATAVDTCVVKGGNAQNTDHNNKNITFSNSASAGGGGGGFNFGTVVTSAPSYVPTTTATKNKTNAVYADPRRIDQILEEMSHLVSCCHLYFAFVESKRQEYVKGLQESEMSQQKEKQEQEQEQEQQQQLKSDSVALADSLLSSRDNLLMNTVQEILAVFVPLQKIYFDAAFDQVLQLQLEALRAAGKDALSSSVDKGGERVTSGYVVGNMNGDDIMSRSSEKTTSSSAKKQATFMTGLAALYASTTAGVDGVGCGDEVEQDSVYQHVSITLPDDVFFFLRIALHRAINTRSTQIISAVFIDCIELVQSKMISVLRRHATLPSAAQLSQLQQRQPGRTVPLRVLRWTSAAQCTTAYIHKLANELRQLARANFTGNDLLRFTEQAEDMDVVSRELLASVGEWLTRFSDVCYQVHFVPHLERFAALSYNFTEEVFYHYELSDPWVRACVATADLVLQPFDEHLDSPSFDKFLLALVQRVVKALWRSLLQKKYSAYGALQVDREIRTLRAFFIGRAHELQLRESFLPLSSAASLLFLDTPGDAEHNVYEGLSAEEKRSVLSCRVEFNPVEIARLRL